MSGLLAKFEHNSVFSDEDAWMLFRVAAIGEAVGWTLLITGIGLSRYVLSNNQIPVQQAGRLHGMLFLLYIVAAVGLYPTLKWSRSKAVVALIASVVPYGSLAFERYVHSQRQHNQYVGLKSLVVYSLLARYA